MEQRYRWRMISQSCCSDHSCGRAGKILPFPASFLYRQGTVSLSPSSTRSQPARSFSWIALVVLLLLGGVASFAQGANFPATTSHKSPPRLSEPCSLNSNAARLPSRQPLHRQEASWSPNLFHHPPADAGYHYDAATNRSVCGSAESAETLAASGFRSLSATEFVIGQVGNSHQRILPVPKIAVHTVSIIRMSCSEFVQL